MSVNTIGIYPTDKKDIWYIMSYVNSVIGVNNVRIETGITNVLICNFKWNDNPRSMFINFNCDCDYCDCHPGPKVIFSLGHDEDAKIIIKKILTQLSHDRDCYFIPDDGYKEIKIISSYKQS